MCEGAWEEEGAWLGEKRTKKCFASRTWERRREAQGREGGRAVVMKRLPRLVQHHPEETMGRSVVVGSRVRGAGGD